jgi:hypothetical protein
VADDDDQSAGQSAPSGFRCELAAWSVLRLGLAELAELRQQPQLRFPSQITPQFLKNSDDQTIASLAGVFAAIESMGQSPSKFREWGVTSATRFVGRGAFAATLHKYGTSGPWGVSVQVVPHNLLHSVSSTISLALPCQGPCMGAGGGVNGEVDALLAAINLLAQPNLPGVWVTWSYWSPELVIDATGKPASDAQCVVGTLALMPLSGLNLNGELEIRMPDSSDARRHGDLPIRIAAHNESKPVLANLANSLLDVLRARPKNFEIMCQLPGGLELGIRGRLARTETVEPILAIERQSFALAKAG